MPKAAPINLGIDHKDRRLVLTIKGKGGHDATTSMDVNDIGDFMALLSQCQHALVLVEAGEHVTLPIDPARAFEPVAGQHALGAYEVHKRHAVGIDSELGAIAVTLLSRKGRLTGIRMSPDAARHLGEGLLKTADEAPSPQRKQ